MTDHVSLSGIDLLEFTASNDWIAWVCGVGCWNGRRNGRLVCMGRSRFGSRVATCKQILSGNGEASTDVSHWDIALKLTGFFFQIFQLQPLLLFILYSHLVVLYLFLFLFSLSSSFFNFFFSFSNFLRFSVFKYFLFLLGISLNSFY